MKRSALAIRDALENDIIHGELSPGDQLEELVLAERFGVSRTPIRETIQNLIADGLAERTQERGARVAKFGPRVLLEMFSVMALLDAEAAALAARRATDKRLRQLKEAQEACRTAAENQDRDAYYTNNTAFHTTIRKAGGNDFLGREATKLHRLLSPYLRTQFGARDRVGTSIAEHDQIVAAISEGDGVAARNLMTKHIEIQGDRFLDLMAFIEDDDD